MVRSITWLSLCHSLLQFAAADTPGLGHIPSAPRSPASAVESLSAHTAAVLSAGLHTPTGLPASGDRKLKDKCPDLLPARDNSGRHPSFFSESLAELRPVVAGPDLKTHP